MLLEILTEFHMSQSCRVRFAPSPTGSLHLGGVRTALYNYLVAKKSGGHFIIRVEDTDLDRNIAEAWEKQLADLKWLGLCWDEGPDIGGDYGPYQQSERGETYRQYAETLVSSGKAFYCFLTEEEQRNLITHENRQLKSPYRDMSLEEARMKKDSGEPCVIRFKNDYGDQVLTFEDLVHGQTTLRGDMVGDFVLIRSNQQPVYNFCCVVDDYLMKISHVLRGEEHLSNTVRQLMLYDAFEWSKPEFGHLSMILGTNRKKLSKRDAAVSVKDFINDGYLPEAILNYVALLGWSAESGEEVFSLEAMTELFGLERVHKSPAMFDRDKLNWLNHHHLRGLTAEQVRESLSEMGIDIENKAWFDRFWTLLGHQFNTLLEIKDTLDIFHTYTLQDKEFVMGAGRDVVTSFKHKVADVEEMNAEVFGSITKEIMQELAVKGKNLFAPIRVALIGTQSGMELKVLAQLMDKQEMLKRIEMALAL